MAEKESVWVYHMYSIDDYILLPCEWWWWVLTPQSRHLVTCMAKGEQSLSWLILLLLFSSKWPVYYIFYYLFIYWYCILYTHAYTWIAICDVVEPIPLRLPLVLISILLFTVLLLLLLLHFISFSVVHHDPLSVLIWPNIINCFNAKCCL